MKRIMFLTREVSSDAGFSKGIFVGVGSGVSVG
jgi:hypothetical protein